VGIFLRFFSRPHFARATRYAFSERQRYYVDLEADRALQDPSIASIHVEAGRYKSELGSVEVRVAAASDLTSYLVFRDHPQEVLQEVPSQPQPRRPDARSAPAKTRSNTRRPEAESEMRPCARIPVFSPCCCLFVCFVLQ
jgi:hypothetical protein